MSQWDARDPSFCRGFEQSTESKEETEETEDVKVYINHYFNMRRNHAVMTNKYQDEIGESSKQEHAPGRYDHKNPTIQKLADERGLSPEQYLADSYTHPERLDEVGQLDTTVEEWREALEVKDDPGETITELMERLGIKRTRLRTMINKLVKEGKAKRGYASRKNSYRGKSYQCAVYQLLKEEEK